MYLSVGQNVRENHNLKVTTKFFQNAANFKYLETTLTNQNCMRGEITNRLIWELSTTTWSRNFLCRLLIRGSFQFSRNHLIYEKHQTLQSFKLHFLQNCPLVQLYTSARLCRCLKRFWNPFFESLFSSSVAFLIMSVALQTRCPFSAASSLEKR